MQCEETRARELRAALRRRFKAVLIDEFQDTDPVQFEIFQAAFGGSEHPLFLIGDPKQAIYAFRGADVFAYLDAAKGAARFSMGVSYRSDPGLIAAVNQLFLPAGSFLIDGINYSAIQARPGAKNGVVAPHAAPGSDTASLELLFVERNDASTAVKKAVARRTAARVVAADIARLLGEKGQHPAPRRAGADQRDGSRGPHSHQCPVAHRARRAA
ncbi:MAG: UvrD-helicase domain-containing protein [Myxococcales bacterium]|nr:UvrD-helicase domain-containing protein [Myxococcales bacterium]